MKTILALVLVNSLFGIGYPLVKTIVHYLTPAQWVFVRVLSSSLILLVFQGKALFSHPITLKQFGGLVLAAFLGITLNQICFVEGLYRSTSGHAAIINATIPLQTILLAWLFGKEKIQQKFDWMYTRISSEKAKQIVKPWYEKAIKELEPI